MKLRKWAPSSAVLAMACLMAAPAFAQEPPPAEDDNAVDVWPAHQISPTAARDAPRDAIQPFHSGHLCAEGLGG